MRVLPYTSVRDDRKPVSSLAPAFRALIAVLVGMSLFSSGLRRAAALGAVAPSSLEFTVEHGSLAKKPCQRGMSSPIGAQCSVGSFLGLETDVASVPHVMHSTAQLQPFLPDALAAQCQGGCVFKPPRIDA